MTSLDFLYIALGVGFIFLVIFICVLLLQLTLILRDTSSSVKNVKEATEYLKKAIMEPLEYLSEVSAGFSFIQNMVDKYKEAKAEKEMDADDDGTEFEVQKIK